MKNLEEKYARFEDILVYNPAEIRGKWAERAGESKGIYMEVGCGKGRFISKLASREPDNFFIAVEVTRVYFSAPWKKCMSLD